jgi:PAS domain S-box-containing protein
MASEGTQTREAAWLELDAQLERLAAEREQYLQVFEAAAQAYLITDAEGTLLDVNGAAVDILQQRKRDLRGRPFASVVAFDQRSAFRASLRGLADLPGGAGSFNTILVAAGTRLEIALSARVMPGGICWRLREVS